VSVATDIAIPSVRPSVKPSFYRPELDVLRFFAFLSVFVYHTLYVPLDHLVGRGVPMWFAQLQVGISRAGAYGVDLFFALSAYLITELLLREKEYRGTLDVKSFYIRRILRIWPLYYVFPQSVSWVLAQVCLAFPLPRG
jgi:peptidoglycan/LPS O-acetylase OafA/YrhL